MRTCVINFLPEFVPMVKAGTKPHTIRALRVDGRDPLPGDMLHLYDGLRTKHARLIRSEACEYTHDLAIQPSIGNMHNVLLAGRPLEQLDIERLAQVDGFKSATELVRFFEKHHGLPFTGLLIGWMPTPVFVTRH